VRSAAPSASRSLVLELVFGGDGAISMNAARLPMGPEDDGVPPVSVCVRCGMSTCPGCALEAAPQRSLLPWEDSRRHWLVRLWQTALVSGLEPERMFGELTTGRVAPALGFAVLAETLALGSLALLGAAGVWLGLPELARQVVRHPEAIGAVLALFVASVLLMLLLHLLWGISLDLGGAFGSGKVNVRHGARFGLYACGWDLMTSPAGLLCSLLVRGPARGFAPVGAAARAARPAQRAYLEACRGFDAVARRRALRLAMVVVGAVVLALGVGLFCALLWLSRQLGY
jgi:hypothetical protein